MKSIINNVTLNQNGVRWLHLLEINITGVGTVYYTDKEIFVKLNSNIYTPAFFTFTPIVEDFALTNGTTTITASNIEKDIMSQVLLNEWRNNTVKLIRVFYNPNTYSIESTGLIPSEDLAPTEDLEPSDFGDLIATEYGYGEAFTGYPKVDLDTITNDNFILFEGLIDSPSGNDSTISLKCVTEFTLNGGKKIINNRSYDQDEFKSIVSSMTEEVIWKWEN